jgi:hypothetical protein
VREESRAEEKRRKEGRIEGNASNGSVYILFRCRTSNKQTARCGGGVVDLDESQYISRLGPFPLVAESEAGMCFFHGELAFFIPASVRLHPSAIVQSQ